MAELITGRPHFAPATAARGIDVDVEEARRQLAQTAGIGLWWFDPRTKLIEGSESWRAMLSGAGISLETPEDLIRHCHPADLPIVSEVTAQALRHGISGSFDHRLRAADGHWMRVRAHVWPEALPGGRNIVHGICQDVTDLAEARDIAVQNHQRDHQLIQDAPYAVAVFDDNLRYAMVSPRWVELFQLEGRSYLGASLEELAPTLRRRDRRPEACARRRNHPTRRRQRHRHSGSGANRAMETRPWRDATGMVAGVMVYVHDISAIVQTRRQAQESSERLQRAQKAAKAADEAKSRFLANVSHEIRTPMNGVLGVLHLLSHHQLPGDCDALVREALGCGSLLQGLLGDVVDFSAIQAGQLTLAADPVLLLGLGKLLKPQAEDKGLSLSIEADPELGVGSVFWLEIAAPTANAGQAAMAPVEGALAGVRILIVEDNATNRMIAQRILAGFGATVETAEDGEHGVEAAIRSTFDLILMDIQMPGIDGIEATRRIRRLASSASTPIIALTANVLPHQQESYRMAGMNGVVSKPISPAALLNEIFQVANAECKNGGLAACA